MTQHRILIIDDEADIRELLGMSLADAGLEPITAATLGEARRYVAAEPLDFVLTDMRLPDGNGLDFLGWMQNQAPGVPVAVITAYGNVETAVEALKAGAFDFITKPLDLARLREVITSGLRLSIGHATQPSTSPQLLGDAPAMHELRALIARVGRSQAPVLITGESGTGKELAARLIHTASARADAPFVPVNCGAIPAELMESELFGHRKGSFTGAVADHMGLIESANGGTLFLDEIAELPPTMQVKFLRVIQERQVRPVGATVETPVDVRFVSATHQDLNARIAAGHFREDLFYRIDVIRLELPPLRERREDIPLLAAHKLGSMARSADTPPLELDAEALALLRTHPFPGNVRELENVLERAVAFASGTTIKAEDIKLRRAPRREIETGENTDSLPGRVDAVTRKAIAQALRAAAGNQSKAARHLGMTPRQLRYRIAKLDIDA